MSAHIIPFPSPFQQQHDYDQAQFAEVSLRDAFVSRAAGVDRLIDAKASFVMENARLRALAEACPEQSERCYILIQTLEENIDRLQDLINRELKGLLYGSGEGSAPSPFLDGLSNR